ncbi:helix-turn-helix domain-containing protein [Geodermatophilus sp. SYSU D00705]
MTATLAAPLAVRPAGGRRAPAPARGDGPRTLAEARAAAGLTATELAQALLVSRPTVAAWEKGVRRPVRGHWPLLGTLLGLPPDGVDALFADHPPARLDGAPLPSLAAVRRRAGLSGRALARLLAVAPTTLSMWETAGVPVPAGVAAELARVLDTDVATLAARPARRIPGPDPRPLRRLRREAGMSQREAAAYLRVALGTLARYEAGDRQVPVAVARRMAVVYRRATAEVVGACGIDLPPLPPGPRWRPREVPEGLRAARLSAGLTRAALGRAVDRSGQTVGAWEAGVRSPGPQTCRRLEVVLGLPAGTLPCPTGTPARRGLPGGSTGMPHREAAAHRGQPLDPPSEVPAGR